MKRSSCKWSFPVTKKIIYNNYYYIVKIMLYSSLNALAYNIRVYTCEYIVGIGRYIIIGT